MRKKRSLALAAAMAVVVSGAGAAAAADAAPEVARLSAAAAVEADDIAVRDTDAPTVIRVGAPEQTIPVTVITDEPVDDMFVGVVSGDVEEGDLFALGYVEGPERGRPAVFKVPVDLFAEDVPAWGLSTWVFDGYREADDAYAYGELDVEVKAHSLLGLAASRSGSSVTVAGSARAFHNVEGRYVPWSGRSVSVQRWTGSAWVQVKGVTTDGRGNLRTTVTVPASSTLRLVTPDQAGTWGAVSAPRTV
ncbi:hypothetical protein WDZ17_14995 [Pseudokineococcus basanitobsidens]|uniref:Surface-anchored protein n=1 Tax=Pseudokineococcus basanitobsidens TaxID=1926649 RepID=A0ABU8RNK5_9ACTN